MAVVIITLLDLDAFGLSTAPGLQQALLTHLYHHLALQLRLFTTFWSFI